MTGLLLLFVGGLWLALAVWLSKIITSKLPPDTWRVLVAVAIFAALLPLPVLDEIVGSRQFEQLCTENAKVQVERATAVGRTVYFVPLPQVEVKGTWVRVVLQPKRFIDVTTGEIVVSYNTLIAAGGRFIRTLGISEGGVPLTFRGTCAPNENVKELFKSLEITARDLPKPNFKGS